MKRELIALIKKHEVLYNTTLADYKDAATRIAAWEQISAKMNMSIDDCKMEWSKLRNCYINALKRRNSLMSRGRILPPWLYESEMNFIKPFVKIGESYGFLPEVDYDSDALSESNKEALAATVERLTYGHNEDYTIPVEEYKDDSYKILKNNQDIVNGMDEVDLFFLGLSQTFKKLPKLEQCRLKLEIFKTLNEAEMKHLESSQRKRKTPKRSSSTE